MHTLLADHPLVLHKLTLLRDARTDTATFRTLADELVTLLAYEATRDIRTAAVEGWASRSGGSLAGAVRGEIHVLRHRLRALQLLDERTKPGSVALTSVGTAAALSGLLARALRPRRHERG